MTTVVKVGTEFLVNSLTTGSQWYPTVTGLSNGGFVVTWQDGLVGSNSGSGALGDSDGSAVHAQIFAADGSKVGGEFLVNSQTTGSQASPVITSLSNGGFVVSWQDTNSTNGDIKAQVYGADGSKVGGELLINSLTANNQSTPAITGLPNGGFVVAWTTQVNSAGDVKAQVYDANGAKVGSEFLVNSSNPNFDQERASIATLANGDFIVTWNDFRTGDWQVRGQVFHPTASGATKVGSEIIVDTAFYNSRMVAGVTGLANGNFVISFEDFGGDIRAQVFTATGAKVGSEFLVNTQTSGNQGFSSITALTSGNFVVTWSDEGTGDGNGSAIKAQVYDASGNKIGGEYVVNQYIDSVQYYPTVAALANGGFVITWQDFSQKLDTNSYGIVAQVFNLSNAPAAPSIVSVTDDVAPNTGVLANGASTNDTNLTVRIATGSNFAGDIVQLFDGQTAIGSAVTLTLADIARGYIDLQTGVLSNAAHAITAKVTDTTGAQSDAATAVNVTVDTVAPAAAVTGVVLDKGNLPTMTVNGTAEAGTQVSVFDGATLLGTVTAGADGSWSLSGVSLIQGTNNLTAKATDAAGNTGTSAAFAAPTLVSTGTTEVLVLSSVAQGFVVLGNGTLTVANRGNVTGQITIGNGGVVNVQIGGKTQHTDILNGGVQFDYGAAFDTTVEAGGVQHVSFGGTATGTMVAAGGFQDVQQASVTGTILNGFQQVFGNGTATDTTIAVGGYQYVGAGGTTQGSIDRGMQYVDVGGTANATLVDIGGLQYVAGTATATTVMDTGTQEVVGTATGTTVNDGGRMVVHNGGVATDTTVYDGGYQEIDGGRAEGTTLGGSQQVLNGGVAVNTEIEASGGQYVGVGGTAEGTLIDIGGRQFVAGTATDTTVMDTGLQEIVGTATGTIVNDGGRMVVRNGGLATNSTVYDGGFQQIVDARAEGTLLGGSQQVLDGGVAVNTEIVDFGEQYVGAGGTAQDTIDRGKQYVAANGTADGTNIDGGRMYVAAGGHASDVDFNGADGSLQLEDTSGLTGTVSNFQLGDTIDFLNLDVVSFDFDGSTLTLNTNSGAHAYQFAGVQSGTGFNVADDGHGGSVVSLSLLVQQAASFAPGSDSSLVPQDTTPDQPALAGAHA